MDLCIKSTSFQIFRQPKQLLKYISKAVVRTFSAETKETKQTKEAENHRTAAPLERAGQLLDEYADSILRLAYSYLHNMSDSEDILQETLIRYMQKAPRFESREHEKAWLLRVAANLSKNRIDYNRLRKTDELEETLVAEEKEDLAFVWDAVKQLPQNYREVIHLYHYEGYRTAEIAKLLGRKETTVRSDLKRGREKLKVILKEAYDFE